MKYYWRVYWRGEAMQIAEGYADTLEMAQQRAALIADTSEYYGADVEEKGADRLWDYWPDETQKWREIA